MTSNVSNGHANIRTQPIDKEARMSQRHGFLLTAAAVCLLAVFPALADAPAAPAAEPPSETREALLGQEGGACVLPATEAVVEMPDAALLPVEPIPAWCPHDEPCPHGFCLNYQDCPEPSCVGGICRYW
jgi:hypothetical protein